MSSNIVGYQKITINTEFALIGAQFVNVGGENKDINDLFTENTLAGLDDSYRYQTSLKTWTGNGYTTYVWYDADDGTEADWEEANSKWLYFNESDVATAEVEPGAAFWIQTSGGAGSVTVAGEVPSDEIAPVTINKEFTLLANPLPKDISIQSIVPDENIPGLDSNYRYQTCLKTWTGNGYNTYIWYDADDGTEADWPEANAKWLYFNESDVADVTIHVGEGFWISTKAGVNGTISFTE